jgi:hypothetical protein
LFGNRWLPQSMMYVLCQKLSDLLPPSPPGDLLRLSPPAEKASARDDETWQAR